MTGPAIQSELFDTLVGFRQYEIAFTADISKMYRCIKVTPEDQAMQLVLWRDSPDEPIKTYRLKTLTYGTAPASYIATKCLNVLAKSVQEQNEQAAFAIANEFYMDDLMTGSSTVEEALELQQTIHKTLADADFQLVKYASNSKELIASIRNELTDRLKIVEFNPNEVISVLGLQWRANDDLLGIKVDSDAVKENNVYSKRSILSLISRVFDPLGLVAPVTVRGKLLMQDIWREEKGWDAQVSEEIQKKVNSYIKDLLALAPFSIDRCYFSGKVVSKQLIAFCDASTLAFGCVAYLRSVENSGKVRSLIVGAKNRVAPVKAITIPRLELQGALLLARFVSRVQKRLNVDTKDVYAFCDSTVALAWIKGPSDQYKQFVRNRSAKINNRLPWSHWRYVNTSENPADLLTRGLTAKCFFENENRWKEGPEWLITEFENRVESSVKIDSDVPEKKIKVVCNVNVSHCVLSSLFDRCSSYVKLVNIIAYVLRITRRDRCVSLKLSADERKRAETALFRLVQVKQFHKEIDSLKSSSPVDDKSPLASLNVFLDSNNLLCVGGRIELSNFSYNIRHPIVISRSSPILKLYALHIHEKYFHASHSFMLNQIRS
jgi:hypothetical protein